MAAAGLIRRGDEILLVHQQDPDATEPNWALPGGLADPGELACEALVREVCEETGLVIRPPFRLLYIAQGETPDERWVAFIYEINHWSGDLESDDPDGHILEPRWVAESEAIARLDKLSWRGMREPIVSYLRSETTAGASWFYRTSEDGETSLITRIEGW